MFIEKLWNQSSVLKETTKFPQHGFSDGTFDKWLHKATLWPQINAYPFEALNFYP
jgi:hypothetical protein